MRVVIFFDGLTEPINPGGLGCWGFIIWYSKKRVVDCGNIGYDSTCNTAEWAAITEALKHLEQNPPKKLEKLTILGDSQLIISQLNEEWQCNKDHLKVFRDQCLEILSKLDCDWVARWIPRECNEDADKLSREAYNLATIQEEGVEI